MVRILRTPANATSGVIKQALDPACMVWCCPPEHSRGRPSRSRGGTVSPGAGVQDFGTGWGSAVGAIGIASRYWGLTPQEYYDAADLWPLDPEGKHLTDGHCRRSRRGADIRDILRQVRGIGAIWAGPGTCRVSMDCGAKPAIQPCKKICCACLTACKEFGVPCATGATADDVATARWSKAFASS